MTIGTSLFLIAAGAILKFAVTKKAIWEIQLDNAGLILMIVGALGLIIGLYLYSRGRREEVPPRAL
jgi:hypothetical protein